MADEIEAKNNKPEQQVDWKAKYEAMRLTTGQNDTAPKRWTKHSHLFPV